MGHRAEGRGKREEAESMEQGEGNKRKKGDGNRMAKFRFQDLRIWILAIEIADELFDIADELEERKLFRFAEQLRAAGMSMSNNIAKGSGSTSKKEFVHFLNIARSSTFENANILIILNRRQLLPDIRLDEIMTKLDSLCRQISNFQATLR